MASIPTDAATTLGDYRRHPGCRLRLACAACGWAKEYIPERVIARLHELRAGGYPTRLSDVAGRVRKPCYRCRPPIWRADFVWPAGMGEREIRRLANLYRN
jgi:hypothetical protein